MNSDEDPSFPFICEGPSGVLAIFEETSGVLPVMSTSAEVADLEDVFAKASMPMQSSRSNSKENTVIAKNSANVLSEFGLAPTSEVSKKAVEVNNPPVLRDSVELAEEIQEVLIESTLVAANSGLVPEETAKTIQEQTSAAVTGSVELAEEIMEAFANSKNVLDTENPVTNDPSTLQEELDRLEQLAVERVREIEGELVSSTKQIAECNLSLNDPKEPKVIEVNENVQKEFESGTVSKIVSNAADVSSKEVGESLCEGVTTIDLTSPSSELVLENAPDVLIAEKSELMVTNTLEAEKIELQLDGKSDNTVSQLKEKSDDTISGIDNAISKLESKGSAASEAEVDNEVSELGQKNDNRVSDTEAKTNLSEKKGAKDSLRNSESGEKEIASTGEENNKLVEKNVKSSNSAGSEVVQIVKEKTQNELNTSNTNETISAKSADANENVLEAGQTTPTAQVVESKNNGEKVKDIHNYETEDDDLEVLEAFIVKTATNPELAVCPVQPSKDDTSSKYSLESTLLDDLTKTDSGSCVNEVETKSGNGSEHFLLAESSGDGTSCLLQRRASREGSSDAKHKSRGNSVGGESRKQGSPLSSGKGLLEKKHLPQPSDKEVVRSGSAAAGSSNKKVEKKVVFVDVKRRSNRSLISSKKILSKQSSAFLRKERSVEQAVSEISVSAKEADEKNPKHDQTVVSKKSVRNPKKLKVNEENEPSTSGIVQGQDVKEHSSAESGIIKMQKRHSEQNTDKLASTSKSTVKYNEKKGEERTGTVAKIDFSPKEKKKSKDIKSNSEEKLTSGTGIETTNDKRNVENNLHSSTPKSNKKEEKKLKEKENMSSTNKNSIKVGSNNSDVTNSRATRSTKKIVTPKSPQTSKLNEHTKEKNKENVEKLRHSVVDDGATKKRTERTVNKETSSLKGDKNNKRQQERDLLEGTRDIKKKGSEISQASAVAKVNKGEKDIESVPKTRMSSSTLNKAEKSAERNLINQKVSSNALKQKRTEEEDLPDLPISTTVLKRKKVEKETEESFPNAQLSPSTAKRKRTTSEVKGSSTEIEIPLSTFKRKNTETEVKGSTYAEQFSPTKTRQDRVEREFEQSLAEFRPVNHTDSNSSRRNLQEVPNVYTDGLFIEFEDITFEMLTNKAKQLVLPTPLWGAQVSSKKDLVVFSRLSTDLSDDKPMIDKALVFQGSLKPIALINNEPIDLPIPCIRTFEDVVILIRNFHTVSFCVGTGVKQKPQSKYCFRYLDVANPGGQCSQCLEERRRLLFGCARKLRERINVMKAAKSRQ